MKRTRMYGYTTIALFAALTAAGAFVRIPLALTVLSFQTLFVMLSGMLLGPKKGALSQLLYVLIGLLGIPVFTGGGGPQYIFQPTFGYLLSFPVAAYGIGRLCRRMKGTMWRYFGVGMLSLPVIYGIGVAYMYLIRNLYMDAGIGLWPLFYAGAVLCLPGDALCCILASLLAVRLVPILTRDGLLERSLTAKQ